LKRFQTQFIHNFHPKKSLIADPRAGGYAQYRTFNDYFTRRLRVGARAVDSDPRAVVSPADGRVLRLGRVGPAHRRGTGRASQDPTSQDPGSQDAAVAGKSAEVIAAGDAELEVEPRGASAEIVAKGKRYSMAEFLAGALVPSGEKRSAEDEVRVGGGGGLFRVVGLGLFIIFFRERCSV
jgi:hypothetical protein